MNSTMNEPVIRKPSSGAAAGDGRDQRVAQHVQPDDAAAAQSLRSRGADVVLLERLEHRAAHDPGEQRHRRVAERDRRQDPGLPAGLDPVRREAGDVSPFDREEVDEQGADQEVRDRVAQVDEHHRHVVDDRVLLQRRDHAERDPDDHGPEHRQAPELERHGEVLLDHVVHVPVALDERRAEVERDDALDVPEVLEVPGLVEVVLALEVALDRRRHGPVRGLERVALDLPHHREGEAG